MAIMARKSVWIAAAVMIGAACGESAGPTEIVAPLMPGAIVVSTETSGFLKADGYELLLAGESRGEIGANDEVTIGELDPATYQVGLGNVRENCSVDGRSVVVAPEQTVTVAFAVVCAYADPTAYTLRFNRSRPKLDTGVVVECPFGICASGAEWDLYVHHNTSTARSVIRQNQTTGVEIAHLPGVTLADLTEEDVAAAAFTTALVGDPFDADRVILIRTPAGTVHALGNPVEDTTGQTLTFDAVLIVEP
jgi:hypothetical protein